jgi:phosphogluconate dehydratase
MGLQAHSRPGDMQHEPTTPMSSTHPTVRDVTDRIRERSQGLRSAYLSRLTEIRNRDPGIRPHGLRQRGACLCGHAARATSFKVVTERAPNIGIVTAYNDMLSAHTPLQATRPSSRTRPASSAPRRRWPAACRPCATA